jgi:hypothetical protein
VAHITATVQYRLHIIIKRDLTGRKKINTPIYGLHRPEFFVQLCSPVRSASGQNDQGRDEKEKGFFHKSTPVVR